MIAILTNRDYCMEKNVTTSERIDILMNQMLGVDSIFKNNGDCIASPKGLFTYNKNNNSYDNKVDFFYSFQEFVNIDAKNYVSSILKASNISLANDKYLHIVIDQEYYWLFNLGTRWELESKKEELPDFIRNDIDIVYEEKDGSFEKYYSIPFVNKSDEIIYRFNSKSLDFQNDELFQQSIINFAKNFSDYELSLKELLGDFDNIINGFEIQMY